MLHSHNFLVAAFALSANAMPAPQGWGPSSWSSTWAPTSTASAASSGQSAFSFPLQDGFPNIQSPSSALTQIELAAHGTLPNGQLPSSISQTSTTTWELIAFNELFEVAFFADLIQNITNNVPGYQIGSAAAQGIVLEALTAIQAQEELHALGANGILKTAGQQPIQPCEYIFPVDNFDDAIEFASTFTDVVLGTLQNALFNFGTDGDGPDFLQLVGSVIGQEGEQNGFYRSLSPEHLIPSALPFLTTSAGPFAFSALNQMVIKPGSCPNSNIINIPIFGALSVETSNLSSATSSIQFSFENTNNTQTSGLSLVYINQQNTPIVEQLQNVQTSGNTVTFQANFPYSQYEMNGLTLAAVTKSAGPFTNASEVASATLFGPGIIEIN